MLLPPESPRLGSISEGGRDLRDLGFRDLGFRVKGLVFSI